MSVIHMGMRAYAAVSAKTTTNQQVADAFHLVISRLEVARDSGPMERSRALADNRRFWADVSDLLSDPRSWLPKETRAGIVSIGPTVQREINSVTPDFDLLITINKQIASGLAG